MHLSCTAEAVSFDCNAAITNILLKRDEPDDNATASSRIMVQTSSETHTDVLIVGAGPAGLMMAMTLARMGLSPMVIDAASYDSHEYGRADALQPRSMEVMQSFGAPLDQLEAMGKKIFGRAFWEISGESTRRTALARFFPPFLDFEKDYALAVRQGLIEQVMIYDIERHCEGFEVQWNFEFLDMELSKIPSGPSTILLRQTLTGHTRRITAKYVVAADGGRSSVRRWAASYGVKFEGESLPVTWCVLDAVNLRSNHPDLERLSSSKGIVLVIPREPMDGKPSARFDIQLSHTKQEATMEEAVRMIKDIFHPYEIDWDEVNWWSAYEAGLGLNTAVLESHNLGWKIGLVLKGVMRDHILSTYGLERHSVAKELIQMDRKLVEIYAGLEKQSIDNFSGASEWLRTLHTFQASHYAYQAGASIVYPRTLLTASHKRPAIGIGKPGIIPGGRIRPAIVTRLSDLVPVPIVAPFDGRFTLYFLVGDLSQNDTFERLLNLDNLLRRPQSIFQRFGSSNRHKPYTHRLSELRPPLNNSASERIIPQGRVLYSYIYDDIPQATQPFHGPTHSIFHTRIITTLGSTCSFVDENIMSLIYPENPSAAEHPSPLFRPQHFFSDDIPIVSPYRQTAPEAGAILEHPMHNKWGVDPDVGSIVVVRPDGHVSLKTVGFDVEAWMEVETYFEGFLIPLKSERTSVKRKVMETLNGVEASVSDM
ncbi:hypothetical protein H0H92_000593 [Tricholoma furcatifolium]|nr:hypothetical protein H0H92_000593 [Tricholoma furcatifolium]